MAEDDFTKQVLDEVEKGASHPDTQRQEHARTLLRAFRDWVKVQDYAKSERKRVNDNVKEQESYLKDALEEPVVEGTDKEQEERISKLNRCESCWQDYQEAKDEKKDITSSMRDNVKAAEQRIRDLMEESNQLGLFA